METDCNGIVAICGSMARSWPQMQAAKVSFERAGYIVLLPTDPESSGIFLEKPYMSKDLLENLHQTRISMATEVYVVNVGGYVGESTLKEIMYAECLDKPITYAYPSMQRYSSWDNYEEFIQKKFHITELEESTDGTA